MVMPVQDPTIGGGTAYGDLLAQLLEQLGGQQENRAGAGLNLMDLLLQAQQQGGQLGTDLLDRLIGNRQFGVGANQDLLDRIEGRKRDVAGTNTQLLDMLQGGRLAGAGQVGDLLAGVRGGRLAGGGLGVDLLGELGRQGVARGGLGVDLLNVLGSQQLGRGGLAADVLGQLQTGALGRGGLGVDLLGTLAQERQGRAGTAQNLFSELLGAEREARRRPVSLVDQLALAGQFGSVMPLSQLDSEQLSGFGLKPGALTGDLQQRILALTEAAPEQAAIIERIMGAMETPEEQAALMDAIFKSLGPLEGQEGIVGDIRGAMQAPGGTDALVAAITESMAATPEEAALLKDALGRLDPNATEEEIMETIRSAFEGSAAENLLTRQISRGLQPTPEEEALTGQLGDLMQPPGQFGDLSSLIGGYAQGAIPQAVVQEVYPSRDGQSPPTAAVRLPDGTYEIVPINGSGLVTIQGSRGPYTVNMDEASSLFTQADYGGTGSLSRGAARRGQAEQLVNQFRTAGPSDLQQLIDFFNAPKAAQQAMAPATQQAASPWTMPQKVSAETNALVDQLATDPNYDPRKLLGFAQGGSVLIDPFIDETQGKKIAGPVTMYDANAQPVGIAGEAGLPETMNIEPRDVRFRAEDIRQRQPGLSLEDVLARARRPGDFETEADPTAIASRLLAGALQRDTRFQDPFVRALSLGRRPSPSDVTAGEYRTLPPDLQQSLASIIGEDLFPSWVFELGMQTPKAMNVRPSVVGGVRL